MKYKFLFAAMLLCSVGAVAQNTYKNPIYKIDFADPSVQRSTDGTFYAYATGCQVCKSSDLVNWTPVNNVFGRPTWNDSTYVKDGKQITDYYSLWASDVNYVNGKYVMYYASALWGNGSRTGIGVATGTSPTRFTDVGRMFRSTEIKVENSIDPCYIEEGDKKFLAWGSFNGIYIAELTDDGLAVKDPSKVTRIAGTAFEGAMIYKRDNYYYLFASTGACCEGLRSTYETVVGRSTSLMGPYINKDGKSMLNNNRTIILTKNSHFVGPGHNSEIITDDAGQDWLLYHAYEVSNPDIGRQMLMDRLKWDAKGWPYIENGTPSYTEQPAPVFYSGNGRNTSYKLEGTDFHRSDFQGWTVSHEGNTVMESGVGTVFNPVMHVKDGSFCVEQSRSGLTDALYEVRLQNYSTAGNAEVIVGSVVTPANNLSEMVTVVPTTPEEVSKGFQKGRFVQSCYGLVVNGKITVALRSQGLASGEEFWAGNVELIRRDNDETALAAIAPWYEERATLALTDPTANDYYKGRLQGYLEELKTATAVADRYKVLVNIHKTLNSMKALDPDYNPTGIEAVVPAEAQDAPQFDTLGRRITDEHHTGIVITRGKKFLRK